MASDASVSWKPRPSIWISDGTYQSFLLPLNFIEEATSFGTPIAAKKWAKGRVFLETPIDLDGPDSAGVLILHTDQGAIELSVIAMIEERTNSTKFEATGEVKHGPAKGAVYELIGWILRDQDNKDIAIHGSVLAVRGSDARLEVELGGMPIGTVGTFVITSK